METPPPTEKAQLDGLTAIRYVAALWVVLYHHWSTAMGAPAPALIAKGYLGVELFFILSGFILCHVYFDQARAGRFRYGAFLWARIARVYPLHLATLAGIGALAGVASMLGSGHGEVLKWSSLPAQLFLLQAWGLGMAGGWNHPSWSISAEWFAYLTFPATLWLALGFRRRLLLAALAAAIFAGALYVAFPHFFGVPLTEATLAWGVVRITPCFLMGAALYLLWRNLGERGLVIPILARIAALSAPPLLAIISAPDPLIIAALGLVILALAGTPEQRPWRGGGQALVYLGEISYAVYMCCIPVGLIYFRLADGIGADGRAGGFTLPLFVLVLTGVAAAAHHLVERPARRWLRQARGPGWRSAEIPVPEPKATTSPAPRAKSPPPERFRFLG
jgi:peptidoglycan/LPS O-acetylase OafA/YrhL